MSVTVGTFITRFPEFTHTESSLIQASIDEALLMVDSTVYGAKADIAVTAYAAHLIALNPLGEMARLDKKGEQTTYLLQYDRIKRSVAAGFRVI